MGILPMISDHHGRDARATYHVPQFRHWFALWRTTAGLHQFKVRGGDLDQKALLEGIYPDDDA